MSRNLIIYPIIFSLVVGTSAFLKSTQIFKGNCPFSTRQRTSVVLFAKKTLVQSLEVLGLKRGCTVDDIKAAFRSQIRNCHPDRDPSPEAAIKFIELTLAYDHALG